MSKTVINRGDTGANRISTGANRGDTGVNRAFILARFATVLGRYRYGLCRWSYGLTRCRHGSPRLVAVLLRFGPVESRFNTVCAGSPRYCYGLDEVKIHRFYHLCSCFTRNRMNYLINTNYVRVHFKGGGNNN